MLSNRGRGDRNSGLGAYVRVYRDSHGRFAAPCDCRTDRVLLEEMRIKLSIVVSNLLFGSP
jgi:hypothetical protein